MTDPSAFSSRSNPFAGLGETPTFDRKPKPVRPQQVEGINQVADESGFVSREPAKPRTPKRKPRLYRTGRNQNFTLKVTGETRDRFHKLADQREVTLARLMELALDALEREKAGS